MRRANGDVRSTSFHTKRPRTIVSALRGFAAIETSKIDFRGIFGPFDFRLLQQYRHFFGHAAPHDECRLRG